VILITLYSVVQNVQMSCYKDVFLSVEHFCINLKLFSEELYKVVYKEKHHNCYCKMVY